MAKATRQSNRTRADSPFFSLRRPDKGRSLVLINIRMLEEERKQWKREAEQRGLSLSEFIRVAVAKDIKPNLSLPSIGHSSAVLPPIEGQSLGDLLLEQGSFEREKKPASRLLKGKISPFARMEW